MKITKKCILLLLVAVLAAGAAFAVTACGGAGDDETPDTSTKLETPKNFTFDSETAEYSFTAVDNAITSSSICTIRKASSTPTSSA